MQVVNLGGAAGLKGEKGDRVSVKKSLQSSQIPRCNKKKKKKEFNGICDVNTCINMPSTIILYFNNLMLLKLIMMLDLHQIII